MIGYHYTSKSLYEKIKVEGLIPYQVKQSALDYIFRNSSPSKVCGIWLWQKELKAESELWYNFISTVYKTGNNYCKIKS